MPEAIAAPPPPARAPAPAPAPSKPAAPTPSEKIPASSGKPVSTPGKDRADIFAQLDQLGAAGDDDAPAPKAPAAPGGQAPDPAKTGTEVEDDEPADPPAAQPPAKPEKAATLRQRKEQLEQQNRELSAKLKEAEERLSKPAHDPEKSKLTETLTARDKRLQELEEEMRFTNYERSSEYQEKYYAPFIEAYSDGRARVSGLTITDQDGNSRKGTAEDFDAIMRITDDDQAATAIEAQFGAGVKSQIVMDARLRTQRANAERTKALDKYRKEGGEREKQRAEQSKKYVEELDTTYKTESSSSVEKYPRLFKPVDGDVQGNELLEKGFEMADAAFSPNPMLKDEHGNPQPVRGKELAKLHAAIRNKAGAFDRKVYQLGQARKQVNELKAKLAEYEASEPGGGGGLAARRGVNGGSDTVAKLNKLVGR